MMLNASKAFHVKTLFLLLFFCPVESALKDYINGITQYFGYNKQNENTEVYGSEFTHSVPYEVTTLDEKFISEAVKLTGVAISELDSCQQRVVLKLKTDCNKMNDEQLAKMAVHLLNCQSYVEGRKIFPCSDELSLKDCTTDMDSDTWTSYHLMSNRARAVCYMVRQSQFRGLAEHTVNRLMEASKDQLMSLGRISHNQESILSLAEDTYTSLSKAQEQLSDQQKDMQQAQLHGQMVLENNIMRLVDEKRLIHETHNKLLQMTHEVQNKLEYSADTIAGNHKELLDDVINIQQRANELFEKIETYSGILLKQNEEFKKQYESTLRNLREVNETVHALVSLVGGTRQALEERLAWIMTALGGTDEAVGRLYLVLWHVGFILTGMLACAFLSARASTRMVIVTLPPFNLAMALSGNEFLNFSNLLIAIGTLIALQILTIWALDYRKILPSAIAWSKAKLTTNKSSSQSSNGSLYPELNINNEEEEESNDTFQDDIRVLTPPISRNENRSRSRSNTSFSLNSTRRNTPLLINMSLRGSCHGTTRAGTPCKLTSLPGRDFCFRHQDGDSVMG
ncbi:unnamed protein product [Ceutorhynchus assimilis]|uniref:Protein brambleberry n=1 Tax=Ceutorhynchus assimilis TaxID=467358 RepID=A0A9N9MMC0_9CUCU|nr:unnamed protein product [Ceutorhynchus assimilis]